jgi:hypothetical protein
MRARVRTTLESARALLQDLAGFRDFADTAEHLEQKLG